MGRKYDNYDKIHSMKALIPDEDNEQYNNCIFGCHKMRNQCTALNNVYCCVEDCKFYKSDKEYKMDRSTGFVRKLSEEELAEAANS